MRPRAVVLAFALAVPVARAQAPLYLADTPFDAPHAATIYAIDPATGTMEVRATLGNAWSPLLGLAAADGRTLYASGTDNSGTICAGSSFACLLLKIVLDPDSTVPESVEVVGPIRHGTTPLAGIVGMTFRDDGRLYVDSQNDSGLYTLDPATAEATFVATISVPLHGGDLTFDEQDRLILWTNGPGSGGSLYEVDPATGAATAFDSEPGFNLAGLAALGHTDVLYGANSFSDRLHQIDPRTGFTGASVPLRLDGAAFDHKRGDLDSPYCIDDSACDDLDLCTRDRCTAGGCRHTFEDPGCDGVDDDCDGETDEDYAPLAVSCGVGACAAAGATACVAGSVVDECAPGLPASEDTVCNGVDDDCDGAVDEDGDPDGDGVSSCFDNCPLAPNAGQENADGDPSGDACDCEPGDPANAPPVEVDNTLEVSKSGDVAGLEWSDGAHPPRFNVYRGVRRPGLEWSYNQYCIAESVSDTTVQDPRSPLPGQVFFYVVSRLGCGESTLARDGDGQAMPNPDPCPSSGQDADGDGVEEAIDTCPGLANPDQADADGDGIGDACE